MSIGAEVLNWDEASFIQNIRLTSLEVFEAFSKGSTTTIDVRLVSW